MNAKHMWSCTFLDDVQGINSITLSCYDRVLGDSQGLHKDSQADELVLSQLGKGLDALQQA